MLCKDFPKLTFIIVVVIVTGSCKVQKPSIIEETDAFVFSDNLLKKYHSVLRPKHLLIENANLKVVNEDVYNLNLLIYIQKDEMLFFSGKMLGFEIFRLKLTNDSIKFINRLNRTYFNGEVSSLSQKLPKAININTLQEVIYTGFLDDIKLTRRSIQENYFKRDSLYVYSRSFESSTLKLFYDSSAQLKFIDFLDTENQLSANLKYEGGNSKSSRLISNIRKEMIDVQIELDFNSLKYTPFEKTDFRVGKNYNETRTLF